MKTALTPEELTKRLEGIAKDKEKLEEDKQAAVEAQNMNKASSISVQLQDIAAQYGMLAAMQKGDSREAWNQMSKVGNSEAAVAALVEGADGSSKNTGKGGGGDSQSDPKPGGGEMGQNGGTGTDAGGTQPQNELDLSDAADAAESRLASILATGDVAAAAKQALDTMQAAFALDSAKNGAAAALQTLAAAEKTTLAALQAATASGFDTQAKQLASTLQAVRDAALQMEKDTLFGKLDIVQEKLDELSDTEASDPLTRSSMQEAARQQAVGALKKLTDSLTEQARIKELAQYSPEQLADLQEQGNFIDQGQEATNGVPENAAIHAADVQSIISRNLSIKLDVPPVIIGDTRYIPLRSVAESFGATVDWDDETRTAIVTTEDGTVSCSIGSRTAFVDGDPVTMDMPAVLVQGRTQVPLRLIAEAIGLQVGWNEDTQTVQIAE